ncbi:MFS transporter [Amycolatopsis suaedae]|uniref:MFS transporter n=1 Tax=Amycolatopsis suaedae TaxID=2510978 RepID=A0A4Q7J2B1_9PSEU|nr:MFS transporter [Amycolatopsis suaedae]RZQ61581.1 MFS transporter [Amycolatopsis suaedae]
MSERTTLADYRAVLSVPAARRPAVASLLARLPIAMIGIAALLYVQRQTGSFAAAGLVSAGALIGSAFGWVTQGRLIDRFGPTRPLLTTSSLFVGAVTALVTAIEAHAATPLLFALALLLGVTQPTVGSASRALWTRLLPSGPVRNAALSYEAISMEVFFVLGPGLAGVLVAAPWPGTGLVVGAATMLIGALTFALSPVIRGWRPERRVDQPLLGALASPGMRTLAVAALGFGVVIGFVEVAVPAAATASGAPVLGGILLSAWSVTSVAFGVAYSMRPWPKAINLRLPVLLGGFSVLVAVLALPGQLWGMAVAMLVAGALIAPQATTHSATIELVAPAGTAAEAFGWLITAVTLGLAGGQSVSGYLVEHGGPGLSFLAAGAAGVVLAALVWALRNTIRPVATPAPAVALAA